MWRRLLSALIVGALTSGVMLALGSPARADVVEVTIGGVTYRADDDVPAAGATVVSVSGAAPQALVLPDTVAIGGQTYVVTAIGDDAASDVGLTSLVLPSSLATVGESAFVGNQLSSLALPDTVTAVGTLSFGSNAIGSLELSDSLQVIDSVAFAGNQLTSVVLPESLTLIGSGAFSFNRLSTITFPASVTDIGDAAFSENPLLTAVFAGPPPTGFTPAGGAAVGSLGDRPGPTVSFDSRFAAPGYAGGFTSPIWQGYVSVATGAAAPGTTPGTTTGTPGLASADPARLRVANVNKHTNRNGVVRLRVRVRNVGAVTATRVRVRVRNRPAGITFPTRRARVGDLAAGERRVVVLRVRPTSKRTTFRVVTRAGNAPNAFRRVSLPPRR